MAGKGAPRAAKAPLLHPRLASTTPSFHSRPRAALRRASRIPPARTDHSSRPVVSTRGAALSARHIFQTNRKKEKKKKRKKTSGTRKSQPNVLDFPRAARANAVRLTFTACREGRGEVPPRVSTFRPAAPTAPDLHRKGQ